MLVLDKSTLLNAVPQIRRLPVPELNGDVFVRPLSGLGRDKFERDQADRFRAGQAPNYRGRLAVLGLVTAAGALVFDETEADAVGAMRADVLDRIVSAIERGTGWTQQDVTDLGKDSA